MPAFMSAAKRKGSSAPDSGRGRSPSVIEIGSTLFSDSANLGALPMPSFGVTCSAAAYQAMAPLSDATILEVSPSPR